MTRTPLFLANNNLLDLIVDADMPISLVAMDSRVLPRFQIPSHVEVLDYRQTLDGIRQGRFSRLIMSPRRGPFLDKARAPLSRIWDMRKKIFDDFHLRQYRIPEVALAQGLRLTVVDRADTFHIAEWDHPLLLAADTYWIRECPITPFSALINTSRRFRRLTNIDASPLNAAMTKVRPMAQGLPKVRMDQSVPLPKKHDIFFIGTNSSPTRYQARKTLQRLAATGEFRIFCPETRLSFPEFLQACAESYLVVSPSGRGWECYRHYESAACASVPVMDYPDIRRYKPFLEGEHAFYYDLEDNGLEKCLRRALADKPRLVEMGLRARAHIMEHHLFAHILRLILEAGPAGEDPEMPFHVPVDS